MNRRRAPLPLPLPLPLLLLLATARVVRGGARFDLYLESGDVEPLMGLAARLYYVRDGRVNANAVGYAVEVPPSVGALNVTWSARTTAAVPLSYRMDVRTDSDFVVPKLIAAAREGTVPVTATGTVFAVSMPCVLRSGSADVRLSVQTSTNWSSPGDLTEVTIAFRKMCADRGHHRRPDNVPEGGDGDDDDDRQDDDGDADPTTAGGRPPFYEQAFFYHMIAIASSMVAMAVICCLTTTYHRDNARDLLIIKGFQQNNEVNVFLKSALNRKLSLPPGSRTRAKDLHECIVELSVLRQRVRLQNIELEGTFGRVYRGVYTDVGGKDEEVFVKTVTDQASAIQVSVLLHEGLSMYGLNHKNILTVLAVSVEQHVDPFLLYPYSNNKNLKKFLQNRCKTTESISCTLTTREIIDITLQIINGMQYLHKNRHLHKDVAARNCLVNQELKILIADNALSRDLFPNDYHCLGDNKNRPIKWMAIESLEHKKFSTASDVWSFGVLLWELLTLCHQPYEDIDPFEMSAYLQDGFRLKQPNNCPDELFTVMACCWALAPNERPTFSQISIFTNEFNNQLVKFV